MTKKVEVTIGDKELTKVMDDDSSTVVSFL